MTGDITNRGQRSEWERFRRAFAPLRELGRLTVVPGNHDRLNEDVGATMMAAGRVVVESHPGLHLVLFDSTGPHNRSLLASHGQMSAGGRGRHHRRPSTAPRAMRWPCSCYTTTWCPCPTTTPPSASSPGWAGARARSWRWAASCWRPCAAAATWCCTATGTTRSPCRSTPTSSGPLSLFNAGSSTELGHVRLFVHRRGRLAAPPVWMPLPRAKPAPFFEYVGSSHVAESGWQYP